MKPTRAATLLLAALLSSASLTGCLGLFGEEAQQQGATLTDEEKLQQEFGNETANKIEERFSENPKVYLFPGQQALPSRTVYYNGTVDPGTTGGLEDKNDWGGNDYNAVEKRFDVSELVPVGQPTELRITLYYASRVGSSADMDILVDVPGNKTTLSRENTDEFNWKFTVKTLTVNTVGVSGALHDIGVQIQNGRVITEPLPFSLKVTATYAEHALTPGIAYAFEVPPEATGVILESVKAGGPENVEAAFVLIDPQDNVVEYREYNDINVPTESIYIKTPAPGQYVFYAYYMRGGFLSLKSDAPLANRDVKALTLTEEVVPLVTAPSPGMGSRPMAATGTSPGGQGGETKAVSVPNLPLEFRVYIKGTTGSVSLNAQATAASSKGLVSELLRYARYDDDKGSLGASHDSWNSEYHPENLAKGDYTIHIVNSGNAEVGYRIVTYTR